MIVTMELINSARSRNGGFSKAQIRMAQKEFGKRWLQGMLGKEATDEFWKKFIAQKTRLDAKKAVKQKIINSVSKPDGWNWKPEKNDIPDPKFNKPSEKKGNNKKKVSRLDNKEFYLSQEWLELRVRVLEKYECKCMMCGRSPKLHGVVIHVDHIKPRSKHPELSLDIQNLQLLCAACNKGKGNRYETDYRPDDLSELSIVANANKLDVWLS